jgi:ankyrin repeat protein
MTTLLLFLCAAAALMAQTPQDDLIDAAKKGHADQVKAMLDAHPELVTAKTTGGVSAILLSVYYRHPEIAAIFVAHGAKLSVAEACATGAADRVAEFLKENPQSANDRSPDGFPVLGLAIFFGHRDTARMLIDAGADVNEAATNAQKVAIIHSAAASGNVEMVRLLIEKGARVNVVQEGGFTPLHEAAAQDNRAMAELLIKAGADLTARTTNGETAADLATARKHPGMAAWLRTLGDKR